MIRPRDTIRIRREETLTETPFNLDITDPLLSTTRAVRRRLDFTRPVARATLLECIRLSQQAPTGTNLQHWRWLVVDDPEQKQRLGALYARGIPLLDESAKTAPDPYTARVYRDARDFAERLGEAPALVVPCLAGRLPKGAPHVVATTYFASIYPAVWSFQLALRSRGLGSVLTTMHLAFEDESREILGLPEDMAQMAMLPVAYTLGIDFKPAKRPPPETITHFNRWSESEN